MGRYFFAKNKVKNDRTLTENFSFEVILMNIWKLKIVLKGGGTKQNWS